MPDNVARALIDALYAGTPAASGCRVNHARGVLVEGRFVPDARATALSRASIFAGGEQRLVARFSSSTGNPDVAEDAALADPRGLAVAVGDALVLVGHSVEAFPASASEEFLAFLHAVNAHEDDPARLDAHLRDHPAACRFAAARTDHPTSFAALRYHMLHGFQLDNAEGQATLGRLSIRGVQAGSAGPASPRADHDYLSNDLRERLAGGPLDMRLEFVPAHAGDPIADIAATWPDRGEAILLGRLIIERVAADQDAQRRLVFDPSRLPDGMSFAGDPMIAARLAAYPIAFRRRLDGIMINS